MHLGYPVLGQDVFDGKIFGYKKSPVIAGDFLGAFLFASTNFSNVGEGMNNNALPFPGMV